jgi:hypothetical protein
MFGDRDVRRVGAGTRVPWPPRAGIRTAGYAYDERGITMAGVEPNRLDDQQLMKELENIHRTRHDTLLHGSDDALRAHNDRMAQLEGEYLRRHPRRPVAAGRTRAGARERSGADRTTPVDPGT